MLGYDELRYFQKVAETGSLRQAAQALNLSQPGLSYTIKNWRITLESVFFSAQEKEYS